MGRKKIQIKKIEDERVRKVTFSKRKGGLVKKAMELSLLCDCDIGLIIFTPKPDQKLYKYATHRMDRVVQKYRTTQRAVETFHNGDYHALYDKKGGKLDSGDNETDFHMQSTLPLCGGPMAQMTPEAVFASQAKWLPPVSTASELGPKKPLSITIPGQDCAAKPFASSGPDSLLAAGGLPSLGMDGGTPSLLKQFVSPTEVLPSPSTFLGLKEKTPLGTTPTAFANFSWSSPTGATPTTEKADGFDKAFNAITAQSTAPMSAPLAGGAMAAPQVEVRNEEVVPEI